MSSFEHCFLNWIYFVHFIAFYLSTLIFALKTCFFSLHLVITDLSRIPEIVSFLLRLHSFDQCQIFPHIKHAPTLSDPPTLFPPPPLPLLLSLSLLSFITYTFIFVAPFPFSLISSCVPQWARPEPVWDRSFYFYFYFYEQFFVHFATHLPPSKPNFISHLSKYLILSGFRWNI